MLVIMTCKGGPLDGAYMFTESQSSLFGSPLDDAKLAAAKTLYKGMFQFHDEFLLVQLADLNHKYRLIRHEVQHCSKTKDVVFEYVPPN